MPYPDSSGNDCPIDGCHRSRGEGKLMCLPHWRQVPQALQQEVYRTWRARNAALGQGGAAYQAAKAAHETAKGQAIRAVEVKQRRDEDAGGSQMYLDRHPEISELLPEDD